MGSGEHLQIETEINNKGEDAFNAMLEVQLPPGVTYNKAETTDPGVKILCSPPTMSNNNTIVCEVGNPLRANRRVTTRIHVMPSSVGFDTPVSEFSFRINAKSSNPEADDSDDLLDNYEEYTVPIRVETDFRVTGKSDPLEVEYNISSELPSKYEYEDEIGEEVFHIYDVKNKGPSTISEAEVHILWPSYNSNGEHLLYLLGFDYDRDRVKCESYKNLNPLAVKVQGSRAYAEFFEQQQQESSFSSSSSSSSSSSVTNEGYGGRSQSFEDTEESLSVVTGAARGPGNYHGSISQAELERQAGGPVFSSSNTNTRHQVENTRHRGGHQGGRHQGGRHQGGHHQGPVVADGAEETRLFDTQGQLISQQSETSQQSSSGSSSGTSSYSSSSSSSSSSSLSSSSNTGSSGSDVVYGGWKLLDNGTYIRVYDNQQQSGEASGEYQVQTGRTGSGSSRQSSQSSSASSEQVQLSGISTGGSLRIDGDELSSNNGDGQDNSGYMNTGWVLQPDGTYVRKQSSWSSSSSSSSSRSSSSGGGAGAGRQSGRGSANSGGSSSSSSFGLSSGSGSNSGMNVVLGAARGPGDYHGTMSRAELEREAGGRVFSSGANTETRHQVDNTQYRAGNTNAGETYSSGSQLADDDVVVTNGGRWVWSEVNNKWEWEAAGGSGDARSSQTSDSGSEDSGWVQLANGTWTRKTSSWSSSAQSSVRYGEDAMAGVGTGAVFSGDQVASRVSSGQLVPAGHQGGEWGDQGDNSTGWVTRPDGTMVKKSSSWASWSSTSQENSGGNLNHIQRQLEQRVRNNLDRQLPGNVEPGFENEYQRNRRHKRSPVVR